MVRVTGESGIHFQLPVILKVLEHSRKDLNRLPILEICAARLLGDLAKFNRLGELYIRLST